MKKNKCLLVCLVLVLCATLSACDPIAYLFGKPAPEDRTSDFNSWDILFQRSDYWKKFVTNPPVTKENLYMIDGSTATIPITAELYRQFFDVSDDDLGLYISHNTTADAYNNLTVSWNRDVWPEDYDWSEDTEPDQYKISLLLATEPSERELEYAKTMGVSFLTKPVARDGFVFIVNKNNPVDSLTVEQVQKIYTGEITNWNQVGGENSPIEAYQREPDSGSQTAMEQMVMKGLRMTSPIKTRIISGMSGLIDAVAEYSNSKTAIGYTYYYYINNLYKSDKIKVLKIDGITPENENLISGKYPFSTNYFAVIRNNEPDNSPARKLQDWLTGEEGQRLVEMAGYCMAN